ncbi:MAG: penicillin-binding protein 2, partial [Planctomycetota bacterium]|nr:penicillin-binding protein 2 [Planctomycetota bacterium]
ISQEQADAVASLKLPGVAFREEYKRCYMNGRTACHVLGFTNIDEVGMEGVEAVLDPLLSSKRGSQVLMRDALGRKITPANGPDSESDARDGKDLYLSLDLVVQQILEEELDALCVKWTPASVSGIVMDPSTGDILALANRPAFDPNDPAAYPYEARRNRALTDPIEPGSTFKPFILAAVLQEKLVSLSQRIDCENGVFTRGGRTLRDASSHGVMTVEEIVSKSSNIGMAKIGIILASACGREVMRDWVRAFDFGTRTDCDMLPLSAESPGKVTELRKWSDYTTTSVSMGHEISVTPMQLVKGYSALANDGVLLQPRIVLAAVEPGSGARPDLVYPEPVVVRRAVRHDITGKVVGVMCKVVTDGTGKKGAVQGYVVAGK